MLRNLTLITCATGLVAAAIGGAAPALATTLNRGGVTMTWDETKFYAPSPTSCTVYKFTYANGTPNELTTLTLSLLSPLNDRLAFEAQFGVTAGETGIFNVQLCGALPAGLGPYTVTMEINQSGQGPTEVSAPVTFKARPDVVRCVNKKTYNIHEYAGKRCPTGWVKR
jgi:hypothetical protein